MYLPYLYWPCITLLQGHMHGSADYVLQSLSDKSPVILSLPIAAMAMDFSPLLYRDLILCFLLVTYM